MATFSRDQRRVDRQRVLDALFKETGSQGGTAAQTRVAKYRADPLKASTEDFAFVGGLKLKRFYLVGPDKDQRKALWKVLVTQLEKPDAADPGGWDGDTLVMQLQAIAEAST